MKKIKHKLRGAADCFIDGVPARDLTEQEFERLAPEQKKALQEKNMYEAVEVEEKPGKDKPDKPGKPDKEKTSAEKAYEMADEAEESFREVEKVFKAEKEAKKLAKQAEEVKAIPEEMVIVAEKSESTNSEVENG
jgi:hypothetical protein